MNLENKMEHLRRTTMEEARAEGNAIIENYREALNKAFEEHKKEALQQSQALIKAETINARQQINRALAKSQTDLKRSLGKVSFELKDKLFKEIFGFVDDFMKSRQYDDYLIKCIRHAAAFAGNDPVTIYINPSDEKKKSYLEEKSGASLTVSTEDFIGGVRAVVRSRNVLIEHSFKTALQDEYDTFVFSGGDGNV